MPSPLISIVTPSFNQAAYLDQAIRSVLDQASADIEYIVMDGGSSDGSVEIIRRHESRLAHWRSAPDAGQADAIFRGFERARGEIIGWLNSDDYYLPGALAHVAAFFRRRPETELLIGGCLTVDPSGREVRRNYGFPFAHEALLHWGCRFNQPASFWRRDAFFAVGGFDRSLTFCFDYDMYLRLTRRRPASSSSRLLAAFRLHPDSKTQTLRDTKAREDRMLWVRYGRDDIPAAESRRIAQRCARAHFARKSACVLRDSLFNPALAWREARRSIAARLDVSAPATRN